MKEIINEAKKIAIRDLRACYHPEGLFASLKNFTDFWARDTFWSSLGMLEIGDQKKVRQSLLLFANYQLPNGKIPRKITHHYTRLKYLGIKIRRRKFKPVYKGVNSPNYSMDDNLLFVIALKNYFQKTKKRKLTKKLLPQANQALLFYQKEKLIKENLLHEEVLCNWMDTVYKRGFVLYTNCLWFEAIKSLELLKEKLGSLEKRSPLPSSITIKRSIRKNFLLKNPLLPKINRSYSFFADTITSRGKKDPFFDLAGNTLTILFEIANKKESTDILGIIERIKKPLTPCVFPRYPFWRIRPIAHLAGISNYQNGISWSWLESLVIVAALKTKKRAFAKKNLLEFAKIIKGKKGVYEVYHLNGEPFDNLFWKSAIPFAWGAGLFIWAAEKTRKTID